MKLLITQLFLSCVLGFYLTSCGDSSADQSSGNPSRERLTAVAGYEVRTRDLSRIVTLSGHVEPLRYVTIGSRMAGTIVSLSVEEGDRVTTGQIVARLDVSEQRAELERATALRIRAEAEYERTRELFERQLVSQSEYENARAELRIAQSDEQLWQTRVNFGEIRASMDAIVTRRYVELGDAVSANEAIYQVTDKSTLVVRVGISELDAVHITRGDSVSIRIDAYPDHQILGTVRRIFPTVDDESRLVTVEVLLAAIPQGVTVRPGNLARLRITVDRRENVLAVPSEALLASTRDRTFVYVIEDDRLVGRDVVVGVQRRTWTEVLDGLGPGEIIVATNPTNLAEGTRVRVTQWRE